MVVVNKVSLRCFASGFDVENVREKFKVQKGTLLLVKLGTSYGQGTRTMAALADVTLTEAGLVIIDFLYSFFPLSFLLRFMTNC